MTQSPPSDPRRRMLVVEDERTVRKALHKYFTAIGYDVDCARELEEAEALVATNRYDIVIADLRLTWSYEGEGLEVLRFVRQHSRGTRVVILSGSDSEDIQQSARALGAEAFLQKPTRLDDIAQTVERLLEERS